MTWPVLVIRSSKKFEFMTFFMFSRSRNPFLTLLMSHLVRVTSKIQVNFRFNRYSEVLIIVSYRFSQFLQYLCFRGQGIHFWHSYWATMFGWPRNSRSTSGSTGSLGYWSLCLMDFHNFFSIMFSRSRNPFLTFLLSYLVRVTSKIQLNFRFNRYSEVLIIVSYRFSQFLQYLCFRGQGIHFWHSYWATMFGWPQKSRSTSGSRGSLGYWSLCLMDFHNFFSIYVFEVKESISDIPTELPCSSDLENLDQLPV